MFGIKWSYFDLDGTIVTKNNEITKRTMMAIQHLKSKNIKIGIATGRSFFFTKNIAKLLNVDLPTICTNGSWIVDYNPIEDRFISTYQKFIEKEDQQKILDFLNENNIDYLVHTANGFFSNSEKNFSYLNLLKTQKSFNENKNYKFGIFSNLKDFYNLDIFKFSLTKSENNLIIDFLNNLEFSSFAFSTSKTFDVFHKDCDKGNAIKNLMLDQKIKKHELMVFGDNENDIGMFKLTSKSIIVGNLNENVKKFARYKTEFDCENEGVADFIFRRF